jgi:hypothetical protein
MSLFGNVISTRWECENFKSRTIKYTHTPQSCHNVNYHVNVILINKILFKLSMPHFIFLNFFNDSTVSETREMCTDVKYVNIVPICLPVILQTINWLANVSLKLIWTMMQHQLLREC